MPDAQPPQHGIVETRLAAGVPTAVAAGFLVTQMKFWEAFAVASNPAASTNDKIAKGRDRRCDAPVFVPEAGADYELRFDLTLESCTVTLSRLAAAADGTVAREVLEVPRITFPSPRNPRKAQCPAGTATAP
jgi:hypothetical protein